MMIQDTLDVMQICVYDYRACYVSQTKDPSHMPLAYVEDFMSAAFNQSHILREKVMLLEPSLLTSNCLVF